MNEHGDIDRDPTRTDGVIIRPEMRREDVRLRGRGEETGKLGKIRKGLLTLHTLELMAVNIYKFQITREPTELNRQLIAAMCNEMVHLQDFQVKLYEYGWKPSPLRWAYWLVGFVFGTVSRLRGKRAILRMGIWVETKANHHYEELLRSIEWDDETRKIVERDKEDEVGHIDTWRRLLASLS